MEIVHDFKELHPLEIPEMALSKMRLRIEKKTRLFFAYLYVEFQGVGFLSMFGIHSFNLSDLCILDLPLEVNQPMQSTFEAAGAQLTGRGNVETDTTPIDPNMRMDGTDMRWYHSNRNYKYYNEKMVPSLHFFLSRNDLFFNICSISVQKRLKYSRWLNLGILN